MDKPNAPAPGARPQNPSAPTGVSSSIAQNITTPTNKNNTAKSTTPKQSSSSITNLAELEPDFVIDVKLSEAPKDAATNNKNIEKLVNLLTSSGFYVQVRQGNLGSIFVFIKSTQTQLRALHIQDGIKDYTYGVQKLIPKDEDLTSEILNSKITPAEKLRLIYDFLTSPTYDSGLAITPTIGEWSFVTSIFPLHDTELNKKWIKRWSTKWVIDDEELNWLRNQFGEKVAFYFAFLQYYFLWLIVPAVVGTLTHFVLGCYSLFFGIFNILWGVIFLASWHRRENILALRWGVKGSSILETPRPAFIAESFEIDKVTSIKKPTSPFWKRVAKQLSSIPLILGAIGVVGILQSLALVIEIFIVQVYHGPLKGIFKFIPTVVLAAVVPTVVAIYRIVVSKVIGWENHATEDSFSYSFNQKLFAVSLVTSTGSLFLTAFVYLPFGHLIIPHLDFVSSYVNTFVGFDIASGSEFEINGHRLEQQVIYLMVTAQVINFFVETFLPFVQRKVFDQVDKMTAKVQATFDDIPAEAQFLTTVRENAKLPEFTVDPEYQEMVIQFAFVNVFGSAWSLAPFSALLNNWVELRGDAGKICFDTRRPIPSRADSIGVWFTDLKYLTWIGTVVTTSLTIMYGPTYHKFSDLTKGGFGLVDVSPRILLAFIIFAEHAYFILCKVVDGLFAHFESSEEVSDQKEKYLIRKDFIASQIKSVPDVKARGIVNDAIEEKWGVLSDTKAQIEKSITTTLAGFKSKPVETRPKKD